MSNLTICQIRLSYKDWTLSKLRPEDQGLRPDGDVAKSERQLWPKGPLRQEQDEREERSVGTRQQGCPSALSTGGVPLEVLRGRSPGDLLEVRVVIPSPVGSETGHEAQHPVSTSPKVGESLFSGTPCSAPARNGPWPKAAGNVACDSLSWMSTALERSSVKESVRSDPLPPMWLTPGPFLCLISPDSPWHVLGRITLTSPWESVAAPLCLVLCSPLWATSQGRGCLSRITDMLQSVRNKMQLSPFENVIGFLKHSWAEQHAI